MNITEIRRILSGARECTLCNCDEADPSTHLVCLSLDQVESISASLTEVELLLMTLLRSESQYLGVAQ